MMVDRLRLMLRFASAAIGLALILLPLGGGSQELVTLAVGGTPADDTAALWYGIDSGMFRRAGLNVTYTKTATGSAATLGVVAGTFQVGVTNALSVIQAHTKGIPIEVVAPSGIYNGTTEFIATVVKKDSALRTGRDLNGRVFGTGGVKDLNSLAMFSWMDKNGGDSKQLRILELPPAATLVALDEGRIDIATLYQPFLAQALASGKVRIFAKTDDAIAPLFLQAVWISTSSWANANPDTVRRFARVIREAGIYCNTHHAESAVLVAKYSNIELQDILKSGRDTFATTFAEPQLLQPVIAAAARYGAIDQAFNAADVISPTVRNMTP
jgi:NitT/TauT family transport system substrate-binding protein